MNRNIAHISFYFILFLLVSCKQEPNLSNTDFDVVVRIDRDIGRVSPILSTSARAREVYQYVFLSLVDYDPKTLELSPVLAESIPEKIQLDDGRIKYECRILDDAVWANGNPITAKDFLFTIKLANHPNVVSPLWKSELAIIEEVILDSDDSKKISFVVKEETLVSMEIIFGFGVYPEHIYDPNGLLSNISLADLRDETLANELVQKDTSLIALASDFSSAKYGMDIVEGAGPYLIKNWETDQYIILERKENWWGANYPDRTLLAANPAEIIFQIISDETTALTQLKGGNIDLMRVKNGSVFHQLESEAQEGFTFHKPKIRQYFYLAINNEDDILKHKEVRKAIALAIDVEKMIEVMESGSAVAVSGTIEPFEEDFKSDNAFVKQDTEKAIQLLEDAGWSDSNSNGTYDKQINGKLVELEINLFASSANSEKLALLVKEYSKTIGIDISISRKKFSVITNDHVYKGDYQMFPMSSRWGLAPYDPFGRWHSDNIKVRGSNLNRYRNQEVDDLTKQIQLELDESKRAKLYHKLDNILYEDQPVIFLYSPLDKIVTGAKIEPLVSSKRPGYFVNAFEAKEVPEFSDN